MTDQILEIIRNNNYYGFFHSKKWQSIVNKVYKVKSNPKFNNLGEDYAFLTNFEVRNIFSGHKWTNMPFNFYPNPLYNEEKLLTKLIIDLINEATNNKSYIELKTTEELPAGLVEKVGLTKTQPFQNSYLHIPNSYDDFLSNLKKSSRKNLNLVYKHFHNEGFKLCEVASVDEIHFLYKMMTRIYRDQHQMLCQPESLFINLFINQDNDYSFKIHYIKKNDQICSAIFTMFDNVRKIAHYSWAINEDQFKKFSLNYVLVNELIIECINNNFKGIDFGTSPLSDSNLLFFKNRWGCETRMVNIYYFNKIQKQPDLNSGFKILRFVFSKIPIRIIQFLNPLIIPQLV